MHSYDFSFPMSLGALLGRVLATTVSDSPEVGEATMAALRRLSDQANKSRAGLDDPAAVGPGEN